MAAPAVIRSGVGFRHCQVLAIAADGYPASTDDTVYEGVTVSGAKALTLTDPEPRQVVHIGDDRPFQLDVLPPTEPVTGEIRTAKTNDTLDAILTDDLSFTVGEAKMFPIGSDQRGDENQVILLAYRQTLDTDPASGNFGVRRWELRLLPKCFVIPRESGFDDTPEEKAYTLRPQFVAQHAWGTALDAAVEGCERAQGFRGISQYKPILVAFTGDNSATEFDFHTDRPCADADKIITWVEGTEQTAGITEATDGLTFQTAPTTDANIVCFYEYE